jgi:hypothetical protein
MSQVVNGILIYDDIDMVSCRNDILSLTIIQYLDYILWIYDMIPLVSQIKRGDTHKKDLEEAYYGITRVLGTWGFCAG